jgi:hypothetical protein
MEGGGGENCAKIRSRFGYAGLGMGMESRGAGREGGFSMLSPLLLLSWVMMLPMLLLLVLGSLSSTFSVSQCR